MTRTRALVQRPGRKVHFATLGAGESSWIAVCNRDVPVFGAVDHGRDWPAWLTAAESDTLGLCTQCRTPLLVAALALHEVEDVRASTADRVALEAENRSLRAELSTWASAFTNEARKALRRREARREARFDVRLAAIEQAAQ